MDLNKRPFKPYITYTVLAINTILFAIMFIADYKLSYPTLVDFGAKVNFRIVDFKLWHLIMPAFLHGSLPHLLFNNLALFYFGPLIEKLLGHVKYAISYLTIGIIATIGSFIFTPNVSLGASGVIYGFMGFHLYLYLLDRAIYTQIFGKSILQLIAVNAILSFVIPNIDIAGHLFGFIGGLIVFGLQSQRVPHALFKPLAIVVLVTILAGFGYSAWQFRQSEDYYITKGAYYYQKGDQTNLLKVDQEYREQFNLD